MFKRGMTLVLTLCTICLLLLSSACAGNRTGGGWSVYTDHPTLIPENVQKAFDKATTGYTGVSLKPVALLASQIVSGTNYRLLCKCTDITQKGGHTGYVRVTIYNSLKGKAKLTEILELGSVKIELNSKKVKLAPGESFRLKAKQTELEGESFTFETGNKNVATVNGIGKITAKGRGTCTITVKSSFGQKATVKVTVR